MRLLLGILSTFCEALGWPSVGIMHAFCRPYEVLWGPYMWPSVGHMLPFCGTFDAAFVGGSMIILCVFMWIHFLILLEF